MRYTEKDRKYIVKNYSHANKAVIAQKYGINLANLRTLVCNLRKSGYDIPQIYSKFPKAKEGFKFCNTCKEEMPLGYFHNSKRSKDGRLGSCAACTNTYNVESKRKNKKSYKKRSKLQDGRVNRIKGEGFKEKPKFKDKFRLNDESMMPEGSYKDCKMIDIPAKYLLGMYDKDDCNIYVKDYVANNLETLKMEVRK